MTGLGELVAAGLQLVRHSGGTAVLAASTQQVSVLDAQCRIAVVQA